MHLSVKLMHLSLCAGKMFRCELGSPWGTPRLLDASKLTGVGLRHVQQRRG